MTLGERIKLAREISGLTQEELGKKCGTTKQTIYKYESGVITNIPLDRLEAIANAANTSATYLMGWDEKEKTADDNTDGLQLAYNEQKFIQWLRSLPPEAREAVLKFPDISETFSETQD